MRIYKLLWHGAKKEKRMANFNFTTKVTIKEGAGTLDYNSKIIMLGSCFTTEIGKIMQDYRFDVMVNPFGVLYNPCSIASSVERLAACKEFTADEVIQTNPTDSLAAAKYASFSHHSSFSRLSGDEFLLNANEQLHKASSFLKEADTVIITLGTAWIYTAIATGKVVSNCHKMLASEFTRSLLSVEECTHILKGIADLLPDKKIIFTVSPIRHLKDGAHGNQISKATLLLAIDRTMAECPNCSYFPSYEIMMDELRDYRFYAEDMVHPSTLAVKYIFEKFRESHISTLAIKQMEHNMRLTKAENHIQK